MSPRKTSSAPPWRCAIVGLISSLAGVGCGAAMFAEAPQSRAAVAICGAAQALRAAGGGKDEQKAADAWCVQAMRAAAAETATVADRLEAARAASRSAGLAVPSVLDDARPPGDGGVPAQAPAPPDAGHQTSSAPDTGATPIAKESSP